LLCGFLCLNARNGGGDGGFARVIVGGLRLLILLRRFAGFSAGNRRFDGGFTRIDRRVGFCGWRLLRRFAGFGTGNRCLNGRFARVDRFLLNHHVLLAGFARFGAGYRRFNGGFTRVDLSSAWTVCAFSA
jgi:hypothetical protein